MDAASNMDRRLWSLLERDFPAMEQQVRDDRARLDRIERRSASRDEWERNMSEDVTTLKRTLDRLTWAIVGTGLTLAGSMVALAITIAGGPA